LYQRKSVFQTTEIFIAVVRIKEGMKSLQERIFTSYRAEYLNWQISSWEIL